jgi:hypothetical protein
MYDVRELAILVMNAGRVFQSLTAGLLRRQQNAVASSKNQDIVHLKLSKENSHFALYHSVIVMLPPLRLLTSSIDIDSVQLSITLLD